MPKSKDLRSTACAGCVSVQASVWDHCHTHSYVRAPPPGRATHHWYGWKPEYGRPSMSGNLDSSYYRWRPAYDAEWNSCIA